MRLNIFPSFSVGHETRGIYNYDNTSSCVSNAQMHILGLSLHELLDVNFNTCVQVLSALFEYPALLNGSGCTEAIAIADICRLGVGISLSVG